MVCYATQQKPPGLVNAWYRCAIRARGHYLIEQAELKCQYLSLLDPLNRQGEGRVGHEMEART
jgi:hypothetical protein